MTTAVTHQVRSEDVPAAPADAGGIEALVRVSDELRPEVGVCSLDVLSCGGAHSAGDVAGLQLGVDFLACPAVERGRLLTAEARVSGVDGEVPCPPRWFGRALWRALRRKLRRGLGVSRSLLPP